MTTTSLHDRLSSVAGARTYRALGELTNTHPETVRRYMQGQSPAVDFLAALCHSMAINADWLLTGRGPMHVSDLRAAALRDANPSELHSAMASTLTSLVERVARLETYCQTLETRLRVASAHSADSPPAPDVPLSSDDNPDPPVVQTRQRATRIAGSVSRRPHPDAD